MKYYFAIFLTIVLTSLSQILLKVAADKRESFVDNIFKFTTFVSYSFFFIATLLSVYALQQIDLKMVMALGAVTIMLTVISAGVFLKEKIHKSQLAGVFIIGFGIIIFSL